VGPSVLLTAAHCVSDVVPGGAVAEVGKLVTATRIEFAVGTDSFSAACSIPSDYLNDASADYALCLINKPINDIVYERLAVDPSDVGLGAIITLTGYGCSGTGSLPINLFDTQTFNMGTAKIVNLPGQLVGAPNFIKVQGNASVCDGDSGSGSFVVEVVAGGMPSRKLVAINVRSSTRARQF
jgi:hypothetical protein